MSDKARRWLPAILLLAAAGCVPRALQVQGRLTDSKGSPQTGSYLLTFKLYGPGHNVPDWMESQYVRADAGAYAAVLGERHPLPPSLLRSDYRIAAEPLAGTGWIASDLKASPWTPPPPPRPARTQSARPAKKPAAMPADAARPGVPAVDSRRVPRLPDALRAPVGASTDAAAAEVVQAQEAEIERLQREVTLLREMVLSKPAGRTRAAGAKGPARTFDQPRVYRVKAGDTLLTISQQLYRTPDRWMDLYQANADRIQRGGDLSEDQVLVLP